MCVIVRCEDTMFHKRTYTHLTECLTQRLAIIALVRFGYLRTLSRDVEELISMGGSSPRIHLHEANELDSPRGLSTKQSRVV